MDLAALARLCPPILWAQDAAPTVRWFDGPSLWLLGGVDHVFFANRRDYFLGLQLRFDDEDLKSLLPFSGSLRP